VVEDSVGNYIAMILPGDESNSEMLLIQREAAPPLRGEEVSLS